MIFSLYIEYKSDHFRVESVQLEKHGLSDFKIYDEQKRDLLLSVFIHIFEYACHIASFKFTDLNGRSVGPGLFAFNDGSSV